MPEVSRLRVALVGPGFPPQVGGIEIYLAHLADGLANLGCEVDVLVQTRHIDSSAERTELLTSGVTVRRFPSWTHSRRFPVAPSLMMYLHQSSHSYDVLHGHSFHAAPGPMAALLSNRPFVFSPYYHGGGHTRLARLAHKPYAPLGEHAFRRASVVIVNSQYERHLVQRDFALPQQVVRVLYPGVDVIDIRAAEPYQGDIPTILVAGRLEEYKQVDLAVRALPLVPLPCHMTVIGTGPSLPYLKRLASDLHISSRITFLAHLSTHDLHRWFATAHVFVSLSRHESFGISLLEAMAAGANIVATAIPASQEVSQLASTEVHFVPVNASPAEVARQISSALKCPRKGVDPARLPSWDSLASECLEAYKQIHSLRHSGISS